MSLLFYTTIKTPRVDYIVSTLLSAIGVAYTITTDLFEYKTALLPKINYSAAQVSDDEIWISPVGLLFGKGIKPQQIDCFRFDQNKVFFKTEGAFPFDILAASFYLITRYEEYLPHDLDEYGRYGHKNSLSHKNGFLELPLVNVWLKEFKSVLLQQFPQLVCNQTPFTFIPTYDIDIAWSYLNKGFLRNLGGAIKFLLKGDSNLLKERVEVTLKMKKDPFDIYDRLDKLHTQHNLKPYYFFLLANKHRGYDRNINPGSAAFQTLIRGVASKYLVGIHPSWQSGDNECLLAQEIETLKDITGHEVINSRQHYIRMQLPRTYRNLIDAGIKADFSMGYGSINGFRASYCLPFRWYDLQKETITDLTVYPFCYMDANSYFEQKYTLEQAKAELEYYYAIIKELNGAMITIFHNHTLGNKQDFNGWKEMYEEFVRTRIFKD